MQPIIDLESAWLDPLIESMCVDEDTGTFSDEARATVDCLVRTSPSVALTLLNMSMGRVLINRKSLVWLLKRRADAISRGVRVLDWDRMTVLGPFPVSIDQDTRFVLSHPLVHGSLIRTGVSPFIAESIDDLALCSPLTKLQALSMDFKPQSSQALSLAPLSSLTALQSLKLYWSSREAVPTTILEPLSALRCLTTLSVSGFRGLTDDAFIPLRDALTGLRHLDVSYTGMTGAFLDHVPTLQTTLTKLVGGSLLPQAFFRCTGLQEIVVSDKMLAAGGQHLFQTFPALVMENSIEITQTHYLERLAIVYRQPIAVRSLSLTGNAFMSLVFTVLTPQILQAFQFLPDLTRLELVGVTIHPTVTQDDLRHFSALTSLERLGLTYNSAPTEGIRILPHIRAPLHDLSCDGQAPVELDQAPELPFASSLTCLETVDIDPTLLSRCTNLRDLSISGASPLHVSVLTSLTKLTSLELELKLEKPLTPTQLPDLSPVSRRLRKLRLNLFVTLDTFRSPALPQTFALCSKLHVLRVDCRVPADEVDEQDLSQPWKDALRGLPELRSFRRDRECFSTNKTNVFTMRCVSDHFDSEALTRLRRNFV